MGSRDKYTIDEFIKAIKGSGAIKTTIAQRLGCDRHTVDNYLNRYATIQQAYDDEAQVTDDMAESVVIQNIKLALQQQKIKFALHQEQQSNNSSLEQQNFTVQPADSSDSKWWLERRRRDRFATRQELTGIDNGPIIIKVEYGERTNGLPKKPA